MEMHEAIRREGLCAGQIAVALRGHDSGRCFLIIKAAGRRVWLVDGKHYFWSKPKEKHVRHVRALKQLEAKDFEQLSNEKNEAQREAFTRQCLRDFRTGHAMEENKCQKKM